MTRRSPKKTARRSKKAARAAKPSLKASIKRLKAKVRRTIETGVSTGAKATKKVIKPAAPRNDLEARDIQIRLAQLEAKATKAARGQTQRGRSAPLERAVKDGLRALRRRLDP